MLSNKRGQSVVEFAIVMPLFVFILIAFTFIGIFMYDYLAMGQLTREIARFAAVGTWNNTIKSNLNIQNRLSGIYTIDPDTNVLVTPGNDPVLGKHVTVEITMVRNDSGIVQMVSALMPRQMSNTLTMREE